MVSLGLLLLDHTKEQSNADSMFLTKFALNKGCNL